MKNKILWIILSFSILGFTGCLTTGGLDFFSNPKTDISFSGTMDPSYGYESLSWGMSYREVEKKGYPLTAESDENLAFYYIGKTERYYDSYFQRYETRDTEYGHGEVNETIMFFAFDRLYRVVDFFQKKPTMEYLRQRYGDFSDENFVTEEMREGGIAEFYTNYGHTSIPGIFSLEIRVYENGKTEVFVYDEFASMSATFTDMLNNNQFTQYTWACYAALDGENKRIDYVFLNSSKTGELLFVGYSKSLENPTLSYVRSGICWSNNASGTYEIKIGANIYTKDFETARWESLYRKRKYTYTYNPGESAREMLELFLNNEQVSFRHNGKVSEFLCNGDDLLQLMNDFGVTWEEIDYAISNEEF